MSTSICVDSHVQTKVSRVCLNCHIEVTTFKVTIEQIRFAS